MRWVKERKGIVFFTTLCLLGIAVLICAALTLMGMKDAYTANSIKYSAQARCLAEAGIERTLGGPNGSDGIMSKWANYSPPAGSQTLGEGTYTVSVTTNTDPTRKLIKSIGTISKSGITVSREVNVQVKYLGPQAFLYSALSGGKLTVSGNSIISDTDPIEVHSNQPGNKAIEVGTSLTDRGTVIGDATAVGTVVDDFNGVTGTKTSGAPSIPLPDFNNAFFNYYRGLAALDNKVITQANPITFNSDPTGAHHVVYVEKAQVTLTGTWPMTGCIVSIEKGIDLAANSSIIINQANNMPALLSKSQNINIFGGNHVINGMVYTPGWIKIQPSATKSVIINGAVYGANYVRMMDNPTYLHYVMPRPPGLPPGSNDIIIISWSE